MDKTNLYFVFEHIQNGTLQDLIRKKGTVWSVMLILFRQAKRGTSKSLCSVDSHGFEESTFLENHA